MKKSYATINRSSEHGSRKYHRKSGKGRDKDETIKEKEETKREERRRRKAKKMEQREKTLYKNPTLK